ncbi:MAG: NACHT domain-containing protein [candidate division WOR-3 bacterium]|nr:NACHT domain-containing protein [candidate division WOR-3 bacterium]
MSEHAEHLINSLPSWLSTPPRTEILPPVETRDQRLPLDQLEWRDFERLCCRLVAQEASIEFCRLYGTAGQQQEGIDFYARALDLKKYWVYQCKRVENLGPAHIEKVVTDFLAGEWRDKTAKFVICTSATLSERKCAEEVERQREVLRKSGIGLEPWDCDEVSRRLKGHPRLVDDFFGREWVRRFCGEEAAERLCARLDSGQLRQLRSDLGKLYRALFTQHDPGLPALAADLQWSPPFEERYVQPDILESQTISVPQGEGAEQRDSLQTTPSGSPVDASSQGSEKSSTGGRSITVANRVGIESWFGGTRLAVVTGEPGIGKTSLLRFIASDILREEPRLPVLAEKWGDHVPVWIPFARLTDKLAKEPDSALSGMLRDWFSALDEERLWPLVEAALNDERLILLVDGLDEWTDEHSASVALDRLQVFVLRREVTAVATCRPQGYELVRGKLGGWRTGRLAGLSAVQRRQLIAAWFRQFALFQANGTTQPVEEAMRQADGQADAFAAELAGRTDLTELAQNPLLLSLLISLKRQNVALPHSRFRAYGALVDHLISTHPQRRRVAAALPSVASRFSEREVRLALASLAFHIHTDYPSGLVPREEAVRLTEQFARDRELGLGISDTRVTEDAERLVDVGMRQVGLLVAKGSNELGFLHRAFQEYLAAVHASRLTQASQLELVAANCFSPQWSDVILGLMHLTSRPDDVRELIGCIQKQRVQAPVDAKYRLDRLLAEVAFCDFGCPPALVENLALDVCRTLEEAAWPPQRESLLRLALDGLRTAGTRPLIREKLRRWFPCRHAWRSSIYEAMAGWRRDEGVLACLWHGMEDEDVTNQLAAANTLTRLAKGDGSVGAQMARWAARHVEPKVRATALWFLVEGWPSHPELHPAVEAARKSNCAELRLAAVQAAIQAGAQTVEDLEELLNLDSWQARLDFRWQKQIVSMAGIGWPKSEPLKRKCLDLLQTHDFSREGIRAEHALAILLSGYPQDADVAAYCAREIRQNQHPFLMLHHEAWAMLAHNFRDQPEISVAADEWIVKQKYSDLEVASAALVGRTSTAKKQLLEHLGGSIPHWSTGALLEGWGMSDPDVAEQLSALATGPAERASRIAHLLPRILTNRAECRKRLIALWKDVNCVRVDFVSLGLKLLGGLQGDAEVVDVLLNDVVPRLERDSLWYDGVVGPIMVACSTDSRLKQLAYTELDAREGCVSAVAAAYGDDPELRSRVMAVCSPLPTGLRLSVAAGLGEGHVGDDLALEVLDLWDHERDDTVKTQASVEYHRQLRVLQRNTAAAEEYLEKAVVAVGPFYEGRRAAAFCGLMELRRTGLVLRAREPVNPERPFTLLGMMIEYRKNPVLMRQIAQSWHQLSQELGDELWRVLSREHPDKDAQLMETLADFAEPESELGAALMRFLEETTPRHADPGLLRFLARARPRSSLLREYCVRSLCHEEWPARPGPNQIVAAELMGEQFPGDSELLARVSSACHDFDARVIALCEGWPDHTATDDAFRAACEEHISMTSVSFCKLMFLKDNAGRVLDALNRAMLRPKPLLTDVETRSIYRSLVARLRQDEGLRALMGDRLRNGCAPSEKATYPKLLRDSSGLSIDVRTWCSEEATRQLCGPELPQDGYDLWVGEVRPVAYAILDALLGA